LINSTKQFNPKVLKALKGNTGATGAVGLRGLTGATGKEGPQGKEGSLGKEGKEGGPAAVLAKGQTEVGTYASWGVVGGYLGTSVTFRIPLSAALDSSHVHFIKFGEASTGECPGKHAAPVAASGNLCVYETGVGQATEENIFPQGTGGGAGSDPYGFGIYFTATGSGGAWDYGTWAVTG
jgi:hypothetical protein